MSKPLNFNASRNPAIHNSTGRFNALSNAMLIVIGLPALERIFETINSYTFIYKLRKRSARARRSSHEFTWLRECISKKKHILCQRSRIHVYPVDISNRVNRLAEQALINPH